VHTSIFLDFSLPNSATWFYFSFLLATAIFYRFDRVFSLRNWDIFTLYLIVPGLLCLSEAHTLKSLMPEMPAWQAARAAQRSGRLLLAGYIWLISGSLYFFFRCLLDLGLEKRPLLSANLNLPGMVWLSIALFLILTVIAVRRAPDTPTLGPDSVALTKVRDQAIAVVNLQQRLTDWGEIDARLLVERSTVILLHVAVVVGLFMTGWRVFNDRFTGVGMACLYLMLPFTAMHVSQVHHVWPACFLLWAVYAYQRPMIAGCLIGVAAGSNFFPCLLFPLWFGFYRGRGAGSFALGFLITTGTSLTITGFLLSGEFNRYLNVALSLSDWQAWKAPKTEGIWTGTHWAYRLPVFIVSMSFIVLTAFWPSPRNLAHVIAQSAAVLIGVQFWYANQGGVYVLWYAPLVLLMFFRPNLSEVRPPLLDTARVTLWNRVRKLVARGKSRTPSISNDLAA
jgi:hypothetical protein